MREQNLVHYKDALVPSLLRLNNIKWGRIFTRNIAKWSPFIGESYFSQGGVRRIYIALRLGFSNKKYIYFRAFCTLD